METRVISVPVTEQSQVAEVRRGCVAVARAIGFDEADAGRVAIVATELASNLLKHGGGGEILSGTFEDATGTGVEIIALDKGPGIPDMGECLRDGYSTAGTRGTGLGAVIRQSQFHELYSRPGLGTAVLARLQPGRVVAGGPLSDKPYWGAVCLAKPGEEVQGDAWAAAALPGVGYAVMVADGLGHGPQAAQASGEAARIFASCADDPPADIVRAIHEGLKSTRGAAVAVARVDLVRQVVMFAGLGNISGAVIVGTSMRRMVSNNGTAGHSAQRVREFEYHIASDGPGLMILHSDGVGTSWSADRYPGLATTHPTLAAALLYRDFNRGRDDATVLVVKTGGRP